MYGFVCRSSGRDEREPGVVSEEHGGQRGGGRAAAGGDRGGVQQVRGRGERHHLPGEAVRGRGRRDRGQNFRRIWTSEPRKGKFHQVPWVCSSAVAMSAVLKFCVYIQKGRDSLQGRFFGGRTVTAQIYDQMLYEEEDFSH